MPVTPIRSVRLPQDPPPRHAPLLPTVVVASYKGGVGKTALTVAIAERLAWAGQRVLLLTCDSQEDARHRLGVQSSDALIARRAYGHEGSVTVAGIRGSKAIDLLYRLGPDKLGLGSFDLAVVDTPPEVQGGSLPGVLLLTPVDGTDAARNLITMLRLTPENTDIMLVRIGEEDAEDWAQNVRTIEQVLGRDVNYLDNPLPRSRSIKQAHDAGRSVWSLPRTAVTIEFLSGVETLAQISWARIHPNRAWPAALPPSSSPPYVPGWDDRR
jgi:cellulose biosynthesis protein BcsQ